MENKKTIFDYMGQVLVVFGVTIILLSVLCALFGEEAKEMSSIFTLGNKGIPIDTMLEFLLVSILVVILRFVFFTDCVIKNLSLILRTVLMYVGTISISVVAIILFEWFPVKEGLGWIGFVVSFTLCTAISIVVTHIKNKLEDDKMQQALDRLKKENVKANTER